MRVHAGRGEAIASVCIEETVQTDPLLTLIMHPIPLQLIFRRPLGAFALSYMVGQDSLHSSIVDLFVSFDVSQPANGQLVRVLHA